MGKTTDDLVRLAHEVSSEPTAREMDMLLTAGERISMALLCMAIIDLGVPAVSFTGSQAGIVTDTAHGKAKILEVRGDRICERRSTAATSPSSPGSRASRPSATSPRSAGAAPTPPPSRWRRRSAPTSARSTPTSPASTPPTRGSCPTPAGSTGCRSTRCSRWRRPAAGCSRCARSSSRATTACPCTCGRASPGSRAPGSTRRSQAWKQPIISGVTHDTSEAKVTISQVPDRPGIAAPAVPRARRRGRQRRHDRAERVDRRPHRHLVHRPARRPRRAPSRSSTRWSSRSRPVVPTSTTRSAGSRSSARA